MRKLMVEMEESGDGEGDESSTIGTSTSIVPT